MSKQSEKDEFVAARFSNGWGYKEIAIDYQRTYRTLREPRKEQIRRMLRRAFPNLTPPSDFF